MRADLPGPEVFPVHGRPSPRAAAWKGRARRSACADALDAPIVPALRGKEFIESDNPFDVGMAGLLGFASRYWAMVDCDARLEPGTPYRCPYERDGSPALGLTLKDLLPPESGTPVDVRDSPDAHSVGHTVSIQLGDARGALSQCQ